METKKTQRNQNLSKADYKSYRQTFVMNKDGSLSTLREHREATKNKW